eukprot:207215_1
MDDDVTDNAYIDDYITSYLPVALYGLYVLFGFGMFIKACCYRRQTERKYKGIWPFNQSYNFESNAVIILKTRNNSTINVYQYLWIGIEQIGVVLKAYPHHCI